MPTDLAVPARTNIPGGLEPYAGEIATAEAIDVARPPGIEDVGFVTLEDYFPPLDINKEQEEELVSWFDRDLKACVRYNEEMKKKWATYRAVYMLEWVEKFYPSMGVSANFTSGLVCDKVLEGLDRLSRAILSPRPLFIIDDEVTNIVDIEVMHRMEWFLHSVLTQDLKIEGLVDPLLIFEFLLDGSAIIDATTMYEQVPERTLKTYMDSESLERDEDRVLDPTQLEVARAKLMDGQPARVMVEAKTLTSKGLKFVHVDKKDHLIPPGVYSDEELKFRGRRLYYTANDLRLLASDDANNWYRKEAVDDILRDRSFKRGVIGAARGGSKEATKEELNIRHNEELEYEWWTESENLTGGAIIHPYKDIFAIYKIACKYGYKTPSDPKGLIPKWCVFEYSPAGRRILRAATYPHFHENRDWIHFKLGHAPKSYYGFGFGARLINEDFLESNAVDLFLDSAAMDTFRPFLAVHPEAGGFGNPFVEGFGPGKIGWVNNIGEFKQMDPIHVSDALLRHLLPLTQTRASNRTSVTPYSQGQLEQDDPRSPAQKARLLLAQSAVGVDAMVKDWNRTGWNYLAEFTWKSCFEQAIYEGDNILNPRIVSPEMLEGESASNIITIDELGQSVVWLSQASSDFINTELRKQKFTEAMSLFMPILNQLAAIDPMLYKKYFMRWMYVAARELDVRRFKYLIPSQQEVEQMPAEALQAMMGGVMDNLVAGQSPGQTEIQTPQRGPVGQLAGGGR
jgi:hypothetical protein